MRSLLKQLALGLTYGAAIIGLSACHGGWNEQVELPESIQQDKKPEEPKPKAVAKDSLQIDVDRFYEFTEGNEQVITIGGRSAFPDSIIELEVITMDRLPGATQDFQNDIIKVNGADQTDPRTGTLSLTWQPDEFFVAEELERKVRMRVELRATVDGLSVYRTEQEFMLFVRRNAEVPEIVSVDGLSDPIREGKLAEFTVKVRDPDSLNGRGDALPPTIKVIDHKFDAKAGGHLVRVNSQKPATQDSVDKSLWTIHMLVNTGNRELVRTTDDFEFSLQAISRFERTSQRKTGKFTVWNQVLAPITTWRETVEFEEGMENIYSFTVFDRKAEGEIDVLWQSRCNDLPGPSVCKCANHTAKGVKICTIRWKPENLGNQRSFRLSYEGINKSRIQDDEDYAKETWQGVIRVKRRATGPNPGTGPGVPPPPPAPALTQSMGGQ